MNKEKLIDRAQKYIQKGYLDKAIADYREISEMDPADISIRLRLGDLLVKANQKEGAIKEYGEVARIYAHKGFYLKAIAVYKQVMKLDETSLDVHHKLADLYTRQRLIVDAVSEYSHIVSAFEKKGKTSDVLELLKKMVSIDPENVGLKLKLAETYKNSGYKEDALSEYCWVVDRFFLQAKLDKAEKILLELYKSHGKEPMVMEGLCELYRRKGETSRFSDYAQSLLDVYTERLDKEKMKALSKAVLEVFPANEKARGILRNIEAGEEAKEAAPPQCGAVKEKASPQAGEGVISPQGSVPKETPLPNAGGKEKSAVLPGEEVKKQEVMERAGGERGESVPSTYGEEEFFEVSIGEEEEAEVLEPIEVVEEVVEEASIEEIIERAGEEEGAEAPEAGLEEKEEEGLPAMPSLAASEGEPAEKEGKEDFVDLSKELGLEEAVDKIVSAWPEGEARETVEEIKAGMGERLGHEDAETHHNMGKAYMEMELFADALREFKISVQNPLFEFDAYTRLGLCAMSTGAPGDAISYYLKALKAQGRSDEERKGLLYELGLAYEAAGNSVEAVEMFRTVYGTDPEYREVSDKVKEFSEEEDDVPKDDDMIEVEFL
ncbi:MAG: tetratricopeptide repeat protein [Deltaproteobacteria bacterium]|nr:tetratricopeptide repeat protein [Deltaproteobacteria bacterium]